MLNPDKKFDMNILQICPPHLSDVATLPWEIKKNVFFQHYYSYTSDHLFHTGFIAHRRLRSFA